MIINNNPFVFLLTGVLVLLFIFVGVFMAIVPQKFISLLTMLLENRLKNIEDIKAVLFPRNKNATNDKNKKIGIWQQNIIPENDEKLESYIRTLGILIVVSVISTVVCTFTLLLIK